MKKLTFFTAFVLVLALCVGGIVSASETTVFKLSLTATDDLVAQGEQVTLTLLITDITSEYGLLSCDLPLRFNPEEFKYISSTPVYPECWGKEADDLTNKREENLSNGLLKLSMLYEGDFTKDERTQIKESGVMGFKVVFEALKDTGVNFWVKHESITPISAAVAVPTVIEGSPSYRISSVYGNGVELKYVPETPSEEPSEEPSKEPSEDSSTESSEESSETSEEPQLPEELKGDADGDGEVTPIDASKVLQYDAGIILLSNPLAADVNNDGEVDPLDASLILKFDAGIIKGF